MSDDRSVAEVMAQRPARAGDLIGGRFRIEGELGSGGMARVFRVTDLATNGAFALKLLRPEIAKDEEAIARLRREGELLDKLDNPAIVGIETYGKLEDGRLFLVMELLEGQTLGALIREHGRLDPEILTPIVTGVAAGLHAAHQAGVVHRDLKPDNIFLAEGATASGPASQTQVKILDFGISKAVGFERLTRTGQVLGTPRYMAPEQLAADHDLDARVDVYAMGVILYEALAGQPPFVAVSPSDMIVAILHGKSAPLRSFRPELGDATVGVVTRAMARARDARYASAHELAEAWLDAVQPKKKRVEAARGMRTKALGGAVTAPGEEPLEEGPSSLKPGTFSKYEDDGGAVVPVPVEAAASAERTAGVRPPREAPAAAPVASQATASSSHPSMATGTLPGLPIANRGLWLLAAALGAGAFSALVVILALHFMGDDDAPPEAPPPLLEAPVASPEETEPEADAEEEPDDLPIAPAPPEVLDEEPAPAVMSRRRRTRRRAVEASTMAQPTAVEITPTRNTQNSEPRSPLQIARAALARGDGEECLSRLEGYGSSPPVLRLRADCQLRAGQRSEAVKSYERFCRRYPTHPSIPEVRAIAVRNGGRCPER